MKWKLLLLIAVTLIILHIPVVGIFFQAANTLMHESGHALAGVLTQSIVYDIQLFASTEGITRVAFHSHGSGIVTGMAGYAFASMIAWLLSLIWSRNQDFAVLLILLFISAVNLLFWVRNLYGIVWVSLFILVLFILSRVRNKSFRRSSTFVVVFIMLIDSVRSAFTVFILSVLHPHAAGDATLLAEFTLIPAPLWGALFFAQALLFGWMGARALWAARPFTRQLHKRADAYLRGD